MSSNAHVPVLLEPVLNGLAIKQDGIYVDGTFGRGGHSKAILERLTKNGQLFAIDRDPDAIAAAPAEMKDDPRLTLVRSDFAELAEEHGGKGESRDTSTACSSTSVSRLRNSTPPLVDSVFFATGRSTCAWIPTRASRPQTGCNPWKKVSLKQILFKYGEERDAARIAKAIVDARERSVGSARTSTAGRNCCIGRAGAHPQEASGDQDVSGDSHFHQ